MGVRKIRSSLYLGPQRFLSRIFLIRILIRFSDNEGIAIFALQCSFFLWIRAMKTGSVFWGILTAFCYFYMVSAWGGYVYIINLIPLHVFCLLLMGRYEHKLYVSYTTFYCVGQLMAMNIPFVGFQPIKTSEHMASAGVFGLLQVEYLSLVV